MRPMDPAPVGASGPHVGVVVAAAGRGTRMGGMPSKILVPLAGVPIIVRAIRPFAALAAVDAIVVVVSAEDLAGVKALLVDHDVPKIAAVVEGGTTRQESVRLGLAAVPACEVVLVHDGARPLVSAPLIERVIAAARDGAAVPTLPLQDTVKSVEGDRVTGTLDRGALARAQTPQGFPAKLLEVAIARAIAEGFEGTDEAMLVERIGAPVRRVAGCADNLKITTPEDLIIAEALLAWHRG